MNSLWKETVKAPDFEALEGSTSTDVLIIGGGMAGILIAHRLKKAGVDCVLLEQNRICGGTTANTTAKISFQHGAIYHSLIRRLGTDGAQLYYKAQEAACREYATLCKTIDCDYEKKDSFVYSLTDRRKMEKEVAALERVGCHADFCSSTPLPFQVAGAVRVSEQAQFHPLKFAYALAKDLPIFENTKVLEVMPGRVKTHSGVVRFRKLIVATHFPILNRHGAFFLKLYQHRSYVMALENAPDYNGIFVDEKEKGLSFRNADGMLLLGGGSHRTGKQGGNWKELSDFAKCHYPHAKPRFSWATQDCMSLDGMPYIGLYSRSTPDILVATGFHKWGMSSSMVSAMVLADLVREKKNAFAALFSPSRSIFTPQLAINSLESLVGLVTPTVPRCPHLGCALKYNRAEHSWDCSCHGSRFSKEGEVLNNPATANLPPK